MYRDREGVPYREATEGARCCTSRDAIAAVSVWNPEALYLTPDLDPAPRAAVIRSRSARSAPRAERHPRGDSRTASLVAAA